MSHSGMLALVVAGAVCGLTASVSLSFSMILRALVGVLAGAAAWVALRESSGVSLWPGRPQRRSAAVRSPRPVSRRLQLGEDLASLLSSAVQASRLRVSKPGEEVLLFAPFEVTFPRDIRAVAAALDTRFAPEHLHFSSSVQGTTGVSRVEGHATDGGVGKAVAAALAHVPAVAAALGAALKGGAGLTCTLLERDIRSGIASWVPSVLRWMLPFDHVVLRETIVTLLRTTGENGRPELVYSTLTSSMGGMGSVLDQGLYVAHPDGGPGTHYCCVLDIRSASAVGGRVLSFFRKGLGAPSAADILARHVETMNDVLGAVGGQ
jgi:hypothetical protein